MTRRLRRCSYTFLASGTSPLLHCLHASYTNKVTLPSAEAAGLTRVSYLVAGGHAAQRMGVQVVSTQGGKATVHPNSEASGAGGVQQPLLGQLGHKAGRGRQDGGERQEGPVVRLICGSNQHKNQRTKVHWG
jgi:hypothetical protein